jgi:urease beta subunit
MKPGEYFLQAEPITANAQRPAVRILVKSRGDRPIQVGSHYHFFEVNRALEFDRAAAYGMRLNIAAGTAVRFEPGEQKPVELTSFGGARVIHGFSGLVAGALDAAGNRDRALDRLREAGFYDTGGKQEKTR